MRNSPRKRGSGAVSCTTPVEIFTIPQLMKIPLGELRNLASEKHGIQNAGLMKKPELHRKLKDHFESRHSVVLQGGGSEAEHFPDSQSNISQTIDKLRNRIKPKENSQPEEETVIEEVVDDDTTVIQEEIVATTEETIFEEVVESSVPIEESSDKLMELAELAAPDHPSELTLQQIKAGEDDYETDDDSQLHIAETCTAVAAIQPDTSIPHHQETVVTEQVIQHEDEMYEQYITSDNVEIVQTEADQDDMAIVTSSTDIVSRKAYRLSDVPCRGYVVASSVKELRDLGRDMLRIHAENHGLEHAGRLRLPDLLKEVIQHYNNVHKAGLELTRLEMLKLNMLRLKKVKVPVREKTPPPDFRNMIPKNVVPLEEQVHHVYEKRPDVCTVDIIVDNLKDMLALGTSILRPEASKHRVANSSRKQKLQVVEELWDHYLKFHLKGTVRHTGDSVEEEYETDCVPVFQEYQDTHSSGFIVVREEDIVQGEEIQAVAEEITE